MLKNIYVGNVYKFISCDSDITDEVAINIGCPLLSSSQMTVPESISAKPVKYELYKENAKLIKLDDSPFSSYILLNESGKYEMVYSIIPFGYRTLFINQDELSLYNDKDNFKINYFKMAKILVKIKKNKSIS